jgi:alcohol dehydrogenase class IV
MRFEFATASRIVFGPGALREAGPAARAMGTKALVVTGATSERARPLLDLLEEVGVASELIPLSGEPTILQVQHASDLSRRSGCDLVIGFGGGSVMDAAKAVAALATNPGELLDYLEVIGRGRQLANATAPCIVVPTTAGTGSEVTRNAVIASPEHRVKVSLRSPHMLPDLAIVDPDLTMRLPPAVTAGTGLDALSQLVEPYVSRRASAFVDPLCSDGIGLVARSLEPAFESNDATARENMSLAAMFSGLALANSGLGAVHGIAGPLGGMFPGAPHGQVCGRLLGPVMRTNIAAVAKRAPTSPARDRYIEVARLLTADAGASSEDGAAWVEALCERLDIPRLGSLGVSSTDIDDLVAKSMRASSMKANPIELTKEELAGILESAL